MLPMLPIRLLVAACACLAVFGCNLSLLTPLLTLTLQERGESAIAIGWIGVATGAGILCAPAFTSKLAARMGSFRCLAASLVFYGFATAAHKLTEDSLAAWIALRFFSAAAATFVFVISEAAIVRAAPAERRGFILGVYGLGFGGGFALGPVVLSVVGIHGWSPYLTAVALTAAVLAVAYPARRDFPDFVDSARPAMFAKIARACPLAFACAFAAGAVENTLGDLLPPYGRRLGMEVAAAALLLTSFGLGSIAQVPIGALVDRAGARRAALLCGALWTIAAVALIWAADWSWMGHAAAAILGGAATGVYPVGLAILGARLRADWLLAGNALFVFSYGAGATLAPLLGGAAMEHWRPPYGFALALAAGGALFSLALLAGRGDKRG